MYYGSNLMHFELSTLHDFEEEQYSNIISESDNPSKEMILAIELETT